MLIVFAEMLLYNVTVGTSDIRGKYGKINEFDVRRKEFLAKTAQKRICFV